MLARQDFSRFAEVDGMAIHLADETPPKLAGVIMNRYRA